MTAERALKITVCIAIWVVASIRIANFLLYAYLDDSLLSVICAALSFAAATALSWLILRDSTKVKARTETGSEISSSITSSELPNLIDYTPQKDATGRIIGTLAVIAVSGIMGVLWLMASIFGTSEMLLSGWAFIFILAISILILIWGRAR